MNDQRHRITRIYDHGPVLGAGQGGALADPPLLHCSGQSFVWLPMLAGGWLPGMPLGAPGQVPHPPGFFWPPSSGGHPGVAACFASLPSWLQAAAMAQSPAHVVNPVRVPLSPGGGVSGEGAGILGGPGIGGGLHVSPVSESSGGDAGLVGEVGGVSVTSDGLGVGFSWPGPRAGSGEGDGRGQWGVGCCWGAGRWPMRLARGFGLLAGLVE